MKKKYVIRSQKGFVTFLTSITTLSMLLGVFLGTSLPLERNVLAEGPKTESHFNEIAANIQLYVEDSLEKEVDMIVIRTNAKEMANKEGLDIVFINEGLYKTKVNIIIDLSNKTKIINTFYIDSRS